MTEKEKVSWNIFQIRIFTNLHSFNGSWHLIIYGNIIKRKFQFNSGEGLTSVEFCLHGPSAAVMSGEESKTDSAKTKAVVENQVGVLFLNGLTISTRV